MKKILQKDFAEKFCQKILQKKKRHATSKNWTQDIAITAQAPVPNHLARTPKSKALLNSALYIFNFLVFAQTGLGIINNSASNPNTSSTHSRGPDWPLSHTATCASGRIVLDAEEHIDPYAKTPWHRSKLDPDICNQYQVFIPENKPSTSAKLEWTENHIEFYEEYKYNEDYAFIYMDGLSGRDSIPG